jgi:hypothetical protein
MNSVTMVRKLRMKRSPTEKKPQKRPYRSLIQPCVPDAGYRPEPDTHLLVDDQDPKGGNSHARDSI